MPSKSYNHGNERRKASRSAKRSLKSLSEIAASIQGLVKSGRRLARNIGGMFRRPGRSRPGQTPTSRNEEKQIEDFLNDLAEGKIGQPKDLPASVSAEAADQIANTFTGSGTDQTAPPESPSSAPSESPSSTPSGTSGDEWPEEQDIELLGRGDLGYHRPGTQALVDREIRTERSSNVYSFVFQRESLKTGILYVTFRHWEPGQTGKGKGPGPTYAYFDVPLQKYRHFEEHAKNNSAGRAVWDYLRQRGSAHGHQHQYRLVSGSGSANYGSHGYVPRKVTPQGFRSRSVTAFGTGKRGFQRSQLPESRFRGAPNRGEPERGEPNRG